MSNCISCGANQFTDNACDYCGTNKTIIVPPEPPQRKTIKGDMGHYGTLEDTILIGDMNHIGRKI